MSFDQRFYEFLFSPTTEAPFELVYSLFSAQEQEFLTNLQANELEIRRLGIQKIHELSPIHEITLSHFQESFLNKLALLHLTEWRRLGLGVALLPFIGRISRSMDGNFRRSIRTVLKEVEIEALDALKKEENLFNSQTLKFDAPSIIWKDVTLVQNAAITAIIQKLCNWPQSIANRATWKLQFSEQQFSQIVTGFQPQHIEVLCKILLPNHPWLLSSNQTQ